MDTHGYYVTNGMVYDPAGILVARIPGRVDLATSAGLDVVRELERQRAENARLRELNEAVRRAGHYDTCDAELSPDMVCSCPARLVSPVPPVSR